MLFPLGGLVARGFDVGRAVRAGFAILTDAR